jgi:glycopeptide antibiotics resistance protein
MFIPYTGVLVLEAVFRGHYLFAFLASAVTAGGGWAVSRLTARKADRPALLGFWAASVLGVFILTLWSTGRSDVTANCVINRDIWEPFGTTQGRLNAAMFVPMGFLGALVMRRWLPSAAVCVGASAVIETAQGALPAIGRACDTSDLIANSAGGVLGALAGWLLVKSTYQSRKITPWALAVRPTAISAIGFVAVLGVVWGAFIQPQVVADTGVVRTVDAKQRAAITDVVSGAFGDYFPINKIQFMSSPGSRNGTIMAIFPVGYVQLSWPDPTDISASLDMSSTGEESGYPVAGVTARPATARQAQDIATAYARKHYPWGPPNSKIQVSAVGNNAALGWMVSWRRYHAGVLMPMRLDVEVDRAGRISQLSVRKGADVSVPNVTIDKKTAAATALKSMPQCTKAEAGELLAVDNGNTWHAVWRVVVSCETSSAVMNVNAHSGAIEEVSSGVS